MHSPSVYQDHAAGSRRSSPYCYPVARSPDRDVAPSSKILHSILHNFAQSTNYMTTPGARFGRELRERVTSVEEGGDGEVVTRGDQDRLLAAYNRQQRLLYAQRVPTTYERNSPLSRYYPGPSATVTSPPLHCREYGQVAYQDDYALARNRSSSLGSTGSSLRESRSPSHDSVASRDSVSRYSPVSSSTSPSPSPPAQDSMIPSNGSKLLGILKGGSYTCNYGNGKYTHSHSAWPATCSSSSSSSSSGRHQLHPVFEVSSSPALPVTAVKRELPSPNVDDVNSKTVSDYEVSWQDEPIDLSCKPKRLRLESVEGPLKSPSVDSGWGSDYLTTSPINDDNCDSPTEGSPPCRSILESILCGKMSSVCDSSRSGSASPIPKPATPSRLEYPCGLIRHEVCTTPCKEEQSPPAICSQSDCPESPCSMTSISTSMPSSPVSSIGSQMSIISVKMPHCPWRQKVTLAKKNLLPVSARVSDWLMKIISFAKLQPEFSGLPETDKVTLMQHCWTRLMLLYMAETNFQFAVTPVHEDTDDGRPPTISGIDPTEPTMDSVELVQNFIRKCQSLQVDAEEFRCLRMYTLFHPGCSGLENVDFVERISSSARQMLQDYVSRTRPGDKLRYSHLLLCLHSLFGVNCGMVQTLFCKHVAKNNDMDQHVKEMMLRCEVFESSDEDSGNECDPRTIDELEKLGNGR